MVVEVMVFSAFSFTNVIICDLFFFITFVGMVGALVLCWVSHGYFCFVVYVCFGCGLIA